MIQLMIIDNEGIFTSDEFELEFSSSSRAELGHFNFRAETDIIYVFSICMLCYVRK